MKINYSPIPDITSKIILAPLVPITFLNKNNECSLFALVDSGAAKAVISTVVAEQLGIHWEKMPIVSGFSVGGSFRSRLFKGLKADILDHTFTFDVNIVEGIGPYKCILGQADLFQRAKITFEAYKKQFSVEFKRYN